MSINRWWSAGTARLSSLFPDLATRAIAIALCTAVIGLLALSYRSVHEWRRSSEMLAEQRAEMTLALLSSVISRDMKGAQVSVLLPLELDDVLREPPYDLRDLFAMGFARFQYPESFFVWKRTSPSGEKLYVFNRPDRQPPWDVSREPAEAYPALIRQDPAPVRPLVAALRRHAVGGRRFVVFEDMLGDVPYQVVAKVLNTSLSGEPEGIVGFTVNLSWVRGMYFSELAREVLRIGDVTQSVALAVQDDAGRNVASTQPAPSGAPSHEREFLPIFFDPAMLSTLSPRTAAVRPWKASVVAAGDPMLAAARRGAGGIYIMLTAAALASVIAMLLTARAVRTRATLATLQTDFVCTVTHELKTPLAFIRLLGETLGRYDSKVKIHEYAALLSQEAWRLTRLIENILTFARVSDPKGQHQFEELEVAELVEDALNHFRPQLTGQGFEVTLDVPPDMPLIRGDRTRLIQALDNLLDNAIKYSADRRALTIRAGVTDGSVQLEVSDRGAGIPPEELAHVFDRFYRGRRTQAGGSGLGLAIVKRVVEDHDGQIEMHSAPAQGTSVRLVLPVAAA